MEYRADLYATGDVWRRTERYVALDHAEAVAAARGLVVALGLDHAQVYVASDGGGLRHLTRVEAER